MVISPVVIFTVHVNRGKSILDSSKTIVFWIQNEKLHK